MNTPSPDLLAKVREWLTKQGYPLELRVGQAFAAAGWGVSHASFDEDPETHKQREIDLYVYMQGHGLPAIQFMLAIECKSSPDKPWVAFSAPRKLRPSAAALMHVPWGAGQEALAHFAPLAGSLPTAFAL